MNLIYVQAATGLKLPKEGEPRNYITDATPVPVHASHYYRKAIADGDLLQLSDKEVAAFKDAQAKAEAEALDKAKADAEAAAKVAKAAVKTAS